MCEAANKAVESTRRFERSILDIDGMRKLAVVRLIEIMISAHGMAEFSLNRRCESRNRGRWSFWAVDPS